MSVTDTAIIDSVINSDEHNDLVLLLIDDLDWSNPQEHLLTMQKKLNTYISFIESGQIISEFPETEGKDVSIIIVCKCEPVGEAIQFLEKATLFLKEKLDVKLRYTVGSSQVVQ